MQKILPSRISSIGDAKLMYVSGLGCWQVRLSFPVAIVLFVGVISSVAFASYFFGKYNSRYNQIQSSELEINEVKAVNAQLTTQIKTMISEVELFNKYMESKYVDNNNKPSASATNTNILTIVAFRSLKANADRLISKSKLLLKSDISRYLKLLRTSGIAFNNEESQVYKKVAFVGHHYAEDYSNQGGPFVEYVSPILNHRTNLTGSVLDNIVNKFKSSKISDDSSTDGAELLDQFKMIVKSLPIGTPIDAIRISSHFGYRHDPLNFSDAVHHGIDMVGKPFAKVSAPADGVVVFAGQKGGYGNYIEISHGNAITTVYGHLHKILVTTGDKINKYDIIGIQGCTGRCTGPHLHLETRYRNLFKDPTNFIKLPL